MYLKISNCFILNLFNFFLALRSEKFWISIYKLNEETAQLIKDEKESENKQEEIKNEEL